MAGTEIVDAPAPGDASARAVAPALAPSARSGDTWWSVAFSAGLLVAWQVYGTVSATIPSVTEILRGYGDDWDLYPDAIRGTVSAAAKGWLGGNLLAVVLAFIAVLLPFTERVVMRFGVALYALPVLAIGPILTVRFSGNLPSAILAGLAVFYTTLVGAVLGLRAADPLALQLVRSLGGNGFTAFAKVRWRAALPSFFAGLRISAPAAMLGAVVGEWFSTGGGGLGRLEVGAQSQLNDARTWGIAIMITAIASVGYAAIALTGRLLTPWAPRSGR